MGKIIERNLSCLDVEGCGSSDARQLYEDGGSKCFSCGKSFFPPTTKEKFEPTTTIVSSADHITINKEAVIKRKIDEIKNYPPRPIAARGISTHITDFFGVKVSYNSNGVVDTHYYPYGDGAYKVRTMPKIFKWIGKSEGLGGKEFFSGGNKRLIICEGEIDRLSVAEATYQKYKKIYPVVNLSSSSMTKSLLLERDWIRTFEEVILCFDEDDAGRKATKEAIAIIGSDKVKITKLPCNDANELFLQKGGPKKLLEAIWEAAPYIPHGILTTAQLKEQMNALQDEPSVPYPPCLEGLNQKVKGMRFGQIALYISGTGCFAKGTGVLMFDGSVRAVEDVVVGDRLMGMDNTQRRVLKEYRGNEKMFKITLRDSSEFTCNGSHILSLVNNDNEGRWGLQQGDIVDVSIYDYLKWSAKRKHLSKMFKSNRLEFPAGDHLSIPPYVLGVWLGDGYSDGGRFACQESDSAIIDKINSYGYTVYKGTSPLMWNAPGLLRSQLIELGLKDNKHIPEIYLKANCEDRLALLAGLLDTDGSYDNKMNGYEFSQKKEHVIKAVKRLAESLGFSTKLGKQLNNKFGNCFRLFISGEGLEDIPCVLPRKRARVRTQIKNPHRYSFSIEELAEDAFFGFEVDCDNRFILDNFIVTHNSGKSTIVREVMLHLLNTTKDKIGIISLEETPGETARSMASMHLCRNLANEVISREDLDLGFDQVFDSDRVIVLDHQGSIKDTSIVDQMEYMALMGCKYLFIDHITILVSEGAVGLTGNEAIDKIMNDLLRIVKKHRIHIGLVSHLRKTAVGGKSFEEGKLPTLDDIKGSGSIKQVSLDIFAFARDMSADEEEIRNHIHCAVLKCRATGLTGPVGGLMYNFSTGRMACADDTLHAKGDFVEI